MGSLFLANLKHKSPSFQLLNGKSKLYCRLNTADNIAVIPADNTCEYVNTLLLKFVGFIIRTSEGEILCNIKQSLFVKTVKVLAKLGRRAFIGTDYKSLSFRLLTKRGNIMSLMYL